MTMLEPAPEPAGAESAIRDYEALIEPLTSPFCEALLRFAGGSGPRERVIDVAAGTGALSLPIARTGASLLACDIAPAAVRRLTERLRPFARAEGRILDGERLDVPEAAFDAAFSAFGVVNFADFDAGLRELARVTRPGGRVAVAVWARRVGSPASAALRSVCSAQFPDRPLPAVAAGTAALSDPAVLWRRLEAAGCRRIDLRLAEWVWTLPDCEWLARQADRLFRDQPLWRGLGERDRTKVRRGLVEWGKRADVDAMIARAWLAMGRKWE